ncbi:hypothetical protein COCSADRAFT_275665 [Bipolaris sorokiniana ND90Pr]|uniref:Uncharacterized protein n=1 Tax=Cochliobolus sativus (strain ND90Pr / ATCC 201652) TaxID=665912 RepID=M2T2J3_COCSN|nr:uncharacterized protein COCSADRAFT_275665 [Bipolaris sorokiniana ND90Pr]EMD68695.1 hypothetical protein COCSADRAFT_275665 [Bipolaris sorokiniana ND90Pr]
MVMTGMGKRVGIVVLSYGDRWFFWPVLGADFGNITASAWLVHGLKYHPFATSLHYYFAVVVTCVTYFTHNKEERDKEKSLCPIFLALRLQLAQITGRGKGADGVLIPHPHFQ